MGVHPFDIHVKVYYWFENTISLTEYDYEAKRWFLMSFIPNFAASNRIGIGDNWFVNVNSWSFQRFLRMLLPKYAISTSY